MCKCKCGMDKESSIRAFSLRRNEVFVPSFPSRNCAEVWQRLKISLQLSPDHYDSLQLVFTICFTRGSTSLAVHPDRHTEVTSDVFSKRDIETCAMRKRAQSAPVKHCWTRSAHEIRVSTAWPWAGHAERRYDHCFMPGIHDAREEENRRNVSYLFHSVCVCASWRMGSLWVREKQSITGCK